MSDGRAPEEQIAIVTGAGQGIGAATARCFAAEGARVVVAEVNLETGAAMEAELMAKGAQAMFVPTDVTDADFGGSHGAENWDAFGTPDPGQQCRHQCVSRSAVDVAGPADHVGIAGVEGRRVPDLDDPQRRRAPGLDTGRTAAGHRRSSV